MAEENDLIEKLQGRDMVNSHAIAKKVNELIDRINIAIVEEKSKKENKENGKENIQGNS